MNRREVAMSRLLWISFPIWIGSGLLAMPLGAQVQYHDITAGPPVTGSTIVGGRYTPQPGATLPPEIRAILTTANLCVGKHLEERTIVSFLSENEFIPRAAQENVIRVITGDDAPDALAALLATGGASEPARRLAEALVGLTLDPNAEGYPDQLAEAIQHFNALVTESSEEFVLNPSGELLTIHAILTMLTLGAECRDLERVEICLVTPEKMISSVEGVLHPATGDTIIAGWPFSDLYDAAALPQYAVSHDWFVESRPISFQRREYVKSGEPRVFLPEELRRAGEYRDVGIFAEVRGIPPYPEIHVPVGIGCEFQPYVSHRPVLICVVTPEGEITRVEASYRSATGDTLIDGRPFSEVHHAGQSHYAAGHDWFMTEAPIQHEGQEYVQFGLRQVLDSSTLRKVGEYNGVPVFADTSSSAPYPEVFLPVGPGCEFQPFLAREAIRIRGEEN